MAEKTIETPPMIEEKSPTKIQTHQEEHKEESEWHQKAKIFNHLLRLFRYLEPDQFGSKSLIFLQASQNVVCQFQIFWSRPKLELHPVLLLNILRPVDKAKIIVTCPKYFRFSRLY